jgi:hypothetical protein
MCSRRFIMAVMMVYDPTIRDYLKRTDVSIKELKELRNKARDVIRRQGNLALALIDLEEEIDRREGAIKR